jgi:hypothetical protein
MSLFRILFEIILERDLIGFTVEKVRQISQLSEDKENTDGRHLVSFEEIHTR